MVSKEIRGFFEKKPGKKLYVRASESPVGLIDARTKLFELCLKMLYFIFRGSYILFCYDYTKIKSEEPFSFGVVQRMFAKGGRKNLYKNPKGYRLFENLCYNRVVIKIF